MTEIIKIVPGILISGADGGDWPSAGSLDLIECTQAFLAASPEGCVRPPFGERLLDRVRAPFWREAPS